MVLLFLYIYFNVCFSTLVRQALVAEEEDRDRAGAAVGGDDGADLADADLRDVRKARGDGGFGDLRVLKAVGVADEALSGVSLAALGVLRHSVHRALDGGFLAAHLVVSDDAPGGERYYCDVGFGDMAVRGPVALSGAETRHGFSVKKPGDWYELWHGGRRVLLFSDLPFEPTDYLAANYMSALAPREKFNREPYVSIMQGDTRVLLRGSTLTRQQPGQARETVEQIADGEALRAALRREFGIEYGK